MLKRTSIKSLFRVTALTMAFFIFAVTGAQSYSLAAAAEVLQRDPGTESSTVENTISESFAEQDPEDNSIDQSENNTYGAVTDENYHSPADIDNLEIVGEDNSTVTPMAFPIVVWAGMGIGQLLGWLAGGAAVTVAIINGYVEAKEFVRELSKSKEKTHPNIIKLNMISRTCMSVNH